MTIPFAAQNSRVPADSGLWDWSGDDVTPEVLALVQGWEDRLQQLIGAADAKASTLLGWSGTALALILTLLVSAGSAGASRGGTPLAAGLLAAGVLLLGGCALTLILAIRPHLDDRPAYGSFTGARHLDADTVIALTLRVTRPDPAGAARHVCVLAAIATRKHQRVRAATTMLLASFGPLLLAAVVGVTA